MQKMVIAIGGNAISPPDKKENVAERLRRLQKVFFKLKPLFKKHRVLLTHGNGFDVGELFNALPLSLDTLGAMTQGQLGYWIEQALTNVLKKEVATIITRVLVDAKDKAFKSPSKPIGAFHNGRRRKVASPKPLKILEEKIIKKIFDAGVVVIAGGGGGIPVVRKGKGFVGKEAVIDKDLCAVKLAELIRAETLLILTNIDAVYLNFGKQNQKRIKHLTIKEAKSLLQKRKFGLGSMQPKVEAAIQFLKGGGKNCFIGPLERPLETLRGQTGTEIVL